MRRQAGIQVAGACDELESEEGSDRPCLAGRDVCRDYGARASRAFASRRLCPTIKVADLDSAQGRAGPAVSRATGMDGQSWPRRKCRRSCRCIDFAPDYRGKQRNRGLATTWARDCSNCELWTRHRAHFIHCNRSRGHYRQQGVHRHYGGRSLGVAEREPLRIADQVQFTPLTDKLSALAGARDASISIGALTVQPGGTGVILAGTGDPNDALDSYYGAGILRSADGGNSWSLIPTTSDQIFAFTGEGFAGFAWSTVNPQLVVAAVSQAYGGTVVNAERPYTSYAGLYYSLDSGLNWSLARITDGATGDVQGPLDAFASPHGNAATAVVWNPIRRLFIAAVRYHGYYQSADGVIWTRMAHNPGWD